MSSILRKLGIMKADAQYEKEKSVTGVLQWDHSARPGMVYHTSADLPFFKLILVRPYESGVFLRDGKIYAVLPEGRWAIDKMPLVGKMEIIWVDLGWQKIRYGLRTLTKDGVEIGANGMVQLKVSSPEKFVTNLVASRTTFSSSDIEEFLSEQLSGMMRAEMANYDVQSIYVEREMFTSVARVKLDETFNALGLEFQNLEVSGILLPDPVREALQKPLIATKEAQVTVLTGTAQAEVLAKIREAGVDPIRLRGAEALMKYAERPATGGGGGALLSGDLLMPLVFYQLLMKDDSIPGNIKGELKKMFPQFSEKAETPTETSKMTHPHTTESKPQLTEKTKHCPECGLSLPLEAKHCPKCGTKQYYFGEN
mgnify:CR=1 FL=1